MIPLAGKSMQFGGYIGCPLKGLYTQPTCREHLGIVEQLKTIGKREGIRVEAQTTQGLVQQLDSVELDSEGFLKDRCYLPWSQDCKHFFQDPATNRVTIGGTSRRNGYYGIYLAELLQLASHSLKTKFDGGNLFLGKDELGNPFALVGRNSITHNFDVVEENVWLLGKERDLEPEFIKEALESPQVKSVFRLQVKNAMGKDLGLPAQRIWELPQPDFHLDMAIRPLQYPDVLVHDLSLTREIVGQALAESTDGEERRKLAIALELVEKEMTLPRDYARSAKPGEPYAHTRTVTGALRSKGFEPILSPGVIRGQVIEGRYDELLSHVAGSEEITPTNYLNAIVHQRANGKLLYITNASPFSTLDKVFTRWLQKTAPEVEQIEFITGNMGADGNQDIAFSLQRDGGIHCLTTEEPDFERWKPLV